MKPLQILPQIVKNKNQNGLTLTELIVSSVLVSIVMLAVVAFNFAIKQIEGATNASNIVAMRSNATVSAITRDASMAVGDSIDRGILFYPALPPSGNRRSLCFRHDTDGDPSDYTGDTWVCYWHDNDLELWRCENPSAPIPITTFAQCDGLNTHYLQLTENEFYSVVEDANNRLEYVEITINTRFDANKSMHNVTNPDYTITTRISPISHSR